MQAEHSTLSLSNLSTGEFMRPVRTQVGQSTLSLSNLSSILPRVLRRMEVGPVMLGEAPNFVQEMRRIVKHSPSVQLQAEASTQIWVWT